MGVRISIFAPQLCNTSVAGLDEYADECLLEKGADWYPFCLGAGSGRGYGGGGSSGVSTPKSKRVVQKQNPPDPLILFNLFNMPGGGRAWLSEPWLGWPLPFLINLYNLCVYPSTSIKRTLRTQRTVMCKDLANLRWSEHSLLFVRGK